RDRFDHSRLGEVEAQCDDQLAAEESGLLVRFDVQDLVAGEHQKRTHQGFAKVLPLPVGLLLVQGHPDMVTRNPSYHYPPTRCFKCCLLTRLAFAPLPASMRYRGLPGIPG